MNCLDTAGAVCSFLQKSELVEVSNVSLLCRAAAKLYLSERERRYFVNPCLREDLVELVPPCQILALRFLEDERKLLVLVRVSSPTLGEEVECSLYVQEALPEGVRSDRRLDLPAQFGMPTSHVYFEGSRFLCCTTREGSLMVFDCIAEALLDLPFGYDGFHASPNGRRCLVDVNRHLYYCSSDTNIVLEWEMLRDPPARSQVRRVKRCREVATAAKLRACLSVERPLLSYPLGNSSSAWRAFWVGQASVLYAHEQGVMLFKEQTDAATERRRNRAVEAAGHRSSECTGRRMPATKCDASAFKAVELRRLSKLSGALAHNSSSTVSNSNGDTDEYVIFNCRDSTLHCVTVSATSTGAGLENRAGQCSTCPVVERSSHCDEEDVAPGALAGVCISEVSLSALIEPRSCIIKEVQVAVASSTYMIFINDHAADRLLFFSADLTLSRWITVGGPSAMTLLVNDGIVITARLPDTVLSDHPVLQTMEGGVGSVFSFSGEQRPDLLDPTLTSITVASSTVTKGDVFAPPAWVRMTEQQSFNGVELLSWAALGVVSASLGWTISALMYNGWWLHLQLLFWGKIN